MENGELRRSIAATRQSFFDEGILDGQFARLEQLPGGNTFVQEFVTDFFRNSAAMLTIVDEELNTAPIDLSKTDRILDRLRRGSALVGAKKVQNETNKIIGLLQEGNLEGARVAFQDLRNERDIFKTKLESYFQQLKAEAAGPASSTAFLVKP